MTKTVLRQAQLSEIYILLELSKVKAVGNLSMGQFLKIWFSSS